MASTQGSGIPESDHTVQQIGALIARIPKLLRLALLLIFLGSVGMAIANPWRYPFIHLLSGLLRDIGYAIALFWAIKLFVMPIVRRQQVVEEWSLLIQGGQEHEAEIIQRTRALMLESKAPNITMEDKQIAPGVLRGAFGDKRPFLVISNDTNANLKSYAMHVNARDYGQNLQVSWYVVHRPRFGEALLRFSMLIPFCSLFVLPIYVVLQLPKAGQAGLLDLDLFDLQDLKAYVTNAHHCVLDAVDKLLLDLSQDPSKIERKSRGFLGVS